ncbi:MAG TPA: phospholipase D family protein [Roseiarcus sp.]|nr:phospholipase D family protein [Roseiarcus sp.]
MIEFLTKREIAEKVRSSAKSAPELAFAVAYWGDGAAAELRLNGIRKPLRILCDLWSGACNPKELGVLLELPNVELRWFDHLHAKIFWTPACAVVGSANASTNGLGQEGKETSGLVEAALCTDDQDVVG